MKKNEILQYSKDFIKCIIALIIISLLTIVCFGGYLSNENNHIAILVCAILFAFIGVLFVLVTIECVLKISIDVGGIEVKSLFSRIRIEWKDVGSINLVHFENVPKFVMCKNINGVKTMLNIPNSFYKEWIVVNPIGNYEFLNIANYFVKMNRTRFIRIRFNQHNLSLVNKYCDKEIVKKVINKY